MSSLTVLAEGLAFPEGPLMMPDGSLVVTEIARGCLTRVDRTGRTSRLADTGGGPNGAARGPDGFLYVCNNGGFSWDRSSGLKPVGRAEDNKGGRIQRVNPDTGKVETLYDRCGEITLSAPNDLVFDAHGGFYFTDHGHRHERQLEFGAVFYAKADGSHIAEVAFPLIGPNGIGLSPDGETLYVAETSSGRLWGYAIAEPGRVSKPDWPSPTGGDLVAGLAGFHRYDSLAVEAGGNIAIATLRFGGINVVSPSGELVERIDMPDPYTTNLCFGGEAHGTAYVTLSSTGCLVSLPWARQGLPIP